MVKKVITNFPNFITKDKSCKLRNDMTDLGHDDIDTAENNNLVCIL